MLKPLKDRCVVRRAKADEMIGSILIPDVAKDKVQRGEVLAVGAKADEVRKGDTVLFGKYAGSDVTVDGDDCVVIEEGDILAIVE